MLLRRDSSRQNLSGRQYSRGAALRASSVEASNGEISWAKSIGPAPRFPRWKRCLDLIFVLATLPVWLPLMVLVMAIIRLNSSGPIFYRQERVGYRRKRFMIFKFRTMHVNAE